MNTLRVVPVAFLLCILHICGQAASGQEDEFSPGLPPQAATIPVELGTIDLATGNLHLEIPLSTLSQRGHLRLNERLVYDSSIWHGDYNSTTQQKQWMPTNVENSSGGDSWGGWRFVDGVSTQPIDYSIVTGPSTCSTSGYEQHQNFIYTDDQGTRHTFALKTIAIINPTARS